MKLISDLCLKSAGYRSNEIDSEATMLKPYSEMAAVTFDFRESSRTTFSTPPWPGPGGIFHSFSSIFPTPSTNFGKPSAVFESISSSLCLLLHYFSTLVHQNLSLPYPTNKILFQLGISVLCLANKLLSSFGPTNVHKGAKQTDNCHQLKSFIFQIF